MTWASVIEGCVDNEELEAACRTLLFGTRRATEFRGAGLGAPVSIVGRLDRVAAPSGPEGRSISIFPSSSYFGLEVRLGDLGQSMFHLDCRARTVRGMLKLADIDYGVRR